MDSRVVEGFPAALLANSIAASFNCLCAKGANCCRDSILREASWADQVIPTVVLNGERLKLLLLKFSVVLAKILSNHPLASVDPHGERGEGIEDTT
jgi:hypothetical protein